MGGRGWTEGKPRRAATERGASGASAAPPAPATHRPLTSDFRPPTSDHVSPRHTPPAAHRASPPPAFGPAFRGVAGDWLGGALGAGRDLPARLAVCDEPFAAGVRDRPWRRRRDLGLSAICPAAVGPARDRSRHGLDGRAAAGDR